MKILENTELLSLALYGGVGILLVFILIVAMAHLPFGAIRALNKTPVPDHIKKIGRKQFFQSSLMSYLILPFDLLSPAIVPFLLFFTKKEDNQLRFLNGIWGNDMSINGDVRKLDDSGLYEFSTDLNNAQEIEMCYWAKGHHPRSFYARWVWLGSRNRASMLNVRFGKEVRTGQEAEYEFWSSNGTPWIQASDKWEWIVRKVLDKEGIPVVSIMSLEPVGGFYVRRYFGHKIPVAYKEWNKAMIAIVGWSIRKRKK
jgi:hypothetical protein